MSATGTLAAFFALELTLCALPGPAVLFTVATTLRGGTPRGFAAVAGIVAGNTTYFALSGFGVVALLLTSYRAFAVLKVAGALYLGYLGLRALLARGETVAFPPASGEPVRDGGRAFAGAFLTQLANPKAIAFFVAIVPQFVVPHGNVSLRIVLLGSLSFAAETLVLSAYVALAEQLRRGAGASRARLWLERAGGAILIAIAAAIAREPLVPAP